MGNDHAEPVERQSDRESHQACREPSVRRARDFAQHRADRSVNAATAYMNLLRDGGVLELQRSNLEVLTEQLRQTKARLESGKRDRNRRVAGRGAS